MSIYIHTCVLHAYITRVPRSRCTYVYIFALYTNVRCGQRQARQGKEVVSSQPARWLSSRIDKPSTDEWINKRKKENGKKKERKEKKNDGHASTRPHGIVHHWLRCPIKGHRTCNDTTNGTRVHSPMNIDKWRIHFVCIVESYFDKGDVSQIRWISWKMYD